MPRIKTVDAIDRQIQQVQADLIRVKARMDRLTAELRGLELERRKRQAVSSDIRIDPQNDIKIDPPSEGIKERHLTCRPVTAGRPWRGKARQMPFLAAAHPRLFIQSYPTQTLSKCLGSRNGKSLFIDCSDACALASS